LSYALPVNESAAPLGWEGAPGSPGAPPEGPPPAPPAGYGEMDAMGIRLDYFTPMAH
jgi:hypothetical protein